VSTIRINAPGKKGLYLSTFINAEGHVINYVVKSPVHKLILRWKIKKSDRTNEGHMVTKTKSKDANSTLINVNFSTAPYNNLDTWTRKNKG